MALPGYLASWFVGLEEAEQVQPAGVDLRVASIEAFDDTGILGRCDRVVPRGRRLEPREGWWLLGPGAYRVRFLDEVRVPPGFLGLCFPRSSLLRMGAALHCAVWDPGYSGRGAALLVVHNPAGVKIERGARVAQMVFLPLSLPAASLYRGAYFGEGLTSSD